MMKKVATLFALSLVLALSVCAFGIAGEKKEVNAASHVTTLLAPSTDLGYINNGESFVFEGYEYSNYQNGYAYVLVNTPVGQSPEYVTHFGRNIRLVDGALKTELIDLTLKQRGKGLSVLPGDFESSYTLPLGGDIKNISEQFAKKYKEVIATGYSLGTTASGIKTWQGMLMQDFKYSDSICDNGVRNPGYAALIYNIVTNQCYVFRDNIAMNFIASSFHKVGTPTSDDFEVEIDGTEYLVQNFASGYIRSMKGLRSAGANIEYKNITPEGFEIDIISGNNAGAVGTVYEKHNENNLADREYVGRLFLERYNEILATGYNPGVTRSFVSNIQNVLLQFYQNSHDGYSTGKSAYQLHLAAFNTVSFSNLSMLAYNPELEQVFLLKNSILTAYVAEYTAGGSSDANYRFSLNIRDLGAPSSEQFTVGGNVYQNFQRGYIRNSSVVLGMNYLETGGETAIVPIDYLGKVGGSVTVPSKMTKDQLAQLFVDKYHEIEGNYTSLKPAGIIRGVWTSGIKSTQQVFVFETQQGVEELILSYDPVHRCVRLIDSNVAKVYKDRIYLGAAISDFESNIQIFEHGYIQKKGDTYEFKAGVYYNPVSKEFFNENYEERVGVIGTLPNKHPEKNIVSLVGDYKYTEVELTEAMRNAYKEYSAAGYNLGIPDDDGVYWMMTGRFGLVVQKFMGGDSTAEYGGRSQMLCYDAQSRNTFIVQGAIFEEYCKNLPLIVGRPSANAVTAKNGVVAQNFFGPMGDFHYRISTSGIVEFFEGAFILSEYERTI